MDEELLILLNSNLPPELSTQREWSVLYSRGAPVVAVAA